MLDLRCSCGADLTQPKALLIKLSNGSAVPGRVRVGVPMFDVIGKDIGATGLQAECTKCWKGSTLGYSYLPYDVLQITHDNGARWDDYFVLKEKAEVPQAIYKVVHSAGQSSRFRIVRDHCGRKIVFGS